MMSTTQAKTSTTTTTTNKATDVMWGFPTVNKNTNTMTKEIPSSRSHTPSCTPLKTPIRGQPQGGVRSSSTGERLPPSATKGLSPTSLLSPLLQHSPMSFNGVRVASPGAPVYINVKNTIDGALSLGALRGDMTPSPNTSSISRNSSAYHSVNRNDMTESEVTQIHGTPQFLVEDETFLHTTGKTPLVADGIFLSPPQSRKSIKRRLHH
jgi:hypothetical protein